MSSINKLNLASIKSMGSKPFAQPQVDSKPRITVIGVGGAGCNAVNNMIRSKLQGCEFLIANTDFQSLEQSPCETKLQLGGSITRGLGAGSKPEVGCAAAEESMQEIMDHIEGSNMLFVTAGMGGGTGTGAAPVIAQVAKQMGILTVGVVTKPFQFEGAHRMRTADRGLEEMQKSVDTLIIIPNQNLFRVSNEKTTFADAFKMADDVLYSGVRSVTDLMIIPGLINLDFADISAVMTEMGKAMMGTGEAEGANRAILAAEAAIANPLLDDVSIRGSKGVLISVTGGDDMTLFEVDEAVNGIREKVEEAENDVNIIFGSTFDERLNGRIRVSVVATGIDHTITHKVNAHTVAKMARDDAIKHEEETVNQIIINPTEEEPNYGPIDDSELNPIVESQDDDHETDQHMFEERNETKYAQPQRKPTLFERFTMSFKGNEPQEAQPTRSMKIRTSPQTLNNQDEDNDISDVPAFLRKNK